MARIDIKSGGTILNDGILQLENGVAMDATLRNVADQNNTTSPLKLSTTAVQVVSPLRITTDDPSDMYLDCEDGATNNRFNITRNTASQQVNLNFASNPAGSTTNVGAIRTYRDGVNLSEVMTFREDGKIGVNNNSPVREVDVVGVVQASNLWTSNGNPVIGSYGTDILLGTNASSKIVMVANRTDIVVNNVDVARFSQTGNFLLNSTASDTARLSIKGSGSTSATTSLLVQNSASVSSLTITDDRTSTFGGVVNITPPAITGGTQFFTVKSGNWPTALIRGFENGTLILGSSTGTFGIDSVSISSKQLTNITFDNGGGFAPNNLINQYGWIFSASYTNAGAGATSEASMIRMAGNTATSIGNVTLNQFAVKNTINNTAGTTINRGYFYDPTVTSVVNTTNIAFQSTSGSVNINTSTIQASAILQADSTTQGFLPPRMTNAQRLAIATPAIGLMVYCTDAVEGIYVYKSTGWTFVI